MPLFKVAATPTVVPDAFCLLEMVKNVEVVFVGTEQMLAYSLPDAAAKTSVDVLVVSAIEVFVGLDSVFGTPASPRFIGDVRGVKAIIPRRTMPMMIDAL